MARPAVDVKNEKNGDNIVTDPEIRGACVHDALSDHDKMVAASDVDIEEESNEMAAVEVPYTIIDPRTVVV